ncbi:Lysine Methyltransferase 2D [Elasticomyces elasticus]|nr:Lysine Methyltransferase 2D [Elasticomyces elasticus]
MFKKVSRDSREAREKECLAVFKHPHIIQIIETFSHNDFFFFGFQYARHTLEELLHTHVRMDERHVQLVARFMYDAIRYQGLRDYIHGAVSVETIRICRRSGELLLSNFDSVTRSVRHRDLPNTDLEDLGVVLLRCMEGRLPGDSLTVANVRARRLENKVFGLNEPGRWSGSKQLMDFLDDLFSAAKPAYVKLEKPHQYVENEPSPNRVLAPLVELATVECFALWQPAEAGES